MTKKELNSPAPLIVVTMYLLLEKRSQSDIDIGNKFFGGKQLSEFDSLIQSLGFYIINPENHAQSFKYDLCGRNDPVELSKEYARQAKIFDKSWNESEATGTQIEKANASRKVNTLLRNILGIEWDAIINIHGEYKLAHALKPENINLESLFSVPISNKKKIHVTDVKQPLLLKAPEKIIDNNLFKLDEIQLNKLIKFEKKHGFISRTKELLEVFNLVEFCGDDIEVLITGESGVGKELIAHAIHNESNRSSGPFIAENCAGQVELLNNLLFGHEKGSFTDAIGMQTGIFEQADNGTLLLDEIGDMTLNMQSRLLRVLQDKRIKKMGSSKEIKVNFRLICATNKNLEKEIEQGRFREDLYYRINAFPIEIPPLKNRLNDIPYLAYYFFNKFLKENNPVNHQTEVKWITHNDFNPLMTFEWKGNVRQLENFIQRFVIINKNDLSRLKPGMLRKIFEDQAINIKELLEDESYSDSIFRADKYIEILLAFVNNRCNIQQTSKNQGIDRDTVRSQLRSSLVQLGSKFDFNENKMVNYLIDSNYISEEKKSMLTGNIIDIFQKIIKIYKDKDAKQYFHKPDEPLVIQLSIIRSDLA